MYHKYIKPIRNRANLVVQEQDIICLANQIIKTLVSQQLLLKSRNSEDFIVEIIVSLLGIVILILIPYLLSENRRLINIRTVAGYITPPDTHWGINSLFRDGDSNPKLLFRCCWICLGDAQGGIEFVFGEVGTLEFGFIFAFKSYQ